MSISAALVKELRERTSAGMMDCKKALQETEGDIDAAAEVLRKKGQAKADKRAGRVAAEGVVIAAISDDSHYGVIAEVNTETDFVAREENFVEFCKNLLAAALEAKVDSIDSLCSLPMPNGQTVDEVRKGLIAKIGENINIRRFKAISSQGQVSAYIHGGRIGVLVDLQGGDGDLGRDIAMHVAASAPLVVRPEQVDEALVEKEKEIFKAQALASGKPAEIVEKMIGGRIKKYLAEVSLYGQAFVKDPASTVEALVKEKQAEVVSFERFVVGEGIEKQVDNFVEEVMAQAKGGE